MRLNVTVPDELWLAVKALSPDLNVSGVLQDGLRGLLSCEHRHTICAGCAAPVDVPVLMDAARLDLAWQLWLRLADHVIAGGTGEGAARVLRDELERQQVHGVGRWALPRPSRAARARSAAPPALDDVRLSRDKQAAKGRHPSARPASIELGGVA